MYILEIWADSDPDHFADSRMIRKAAATLEASKHHAGLFSLPVPMIVGLPDGLEVEVTCERVATGDVHCGISHDGQLLLSGKYPGPFTARVFPPGHDAYVINLRAAAD